MLKPDIPRVSSTNRSIVAQPTDARTATKASKETPSAYRIFAKKPKVPQMEAAAPTRGCRRKDLWTKGVPPWLSEGARLEIIPSPRR
jgi:hypothetical protein